MSTAHSDAGLLQVAGAHEERHLELACGTERSVAEVGVVRCQTVVDSMTFVYGKSTCMLQQLCRQGAEVYLYRLAQQTAALVTIEKRMAREG